MIEGLNDVGFLDLEKHIQESLPPLESPKFLDVGCATGVLVRYMYDRGWDSMGLEVCVPAAEYAQANRGVRVQVGTLESQEWQWGTYDLIHSSHVIEHVPDPNEYLSLQHKLLKPGGYIIVTTPNTKSFQAAFMGASWRSAIADHVHLFSRTHLGELLVRAGFEPKEWKTWGGIPLGMAPKGVKRSADWLAKRLGLGDVMIFLAKKPKKSDA